MTPNSHFKLFVSKTHLEKVEYRLLLTPGISDLLNKFMSGKR